MCWRKRCPCFACESWWLLFFCQPVHCACVKMTSHVGKHETSYWSVSLKSSQQCNNDLRPNLNFGLHQYSLFATPLELVSKPSSAGLNPLKIVCKHGAWKTISKQHSGRHSNGRELEVREITTEGCHTQK